MGFAEFLRDVSEQPTLGSRQIDNAEGVLRLAHEFNRDAGLSIEVPPAIPSDAIILEAGHQPNFLPHAGTWRKAFLLDYIAKKLRERGESVVAVFGFADYNISTASVLHQNRVPDVTKVGYRKIGFNLSDKAKWKKFMSQPVPTEAELAEQSRKALDLFETNFRRARIPPEVAQTNLGGVQAELWESRRLASNFADYNAFTFARICSNHMGMELVFFRHSGVQRDGIFIDEAARLASDVQRFNMECGKSTRELGLTDELGGVEDFFFPFWYHCDCGGKVKLTRDLANPPECAGECLACGKTHALRMDDEGFRAHYADMAPTAVARNMIFSEGLGNSLYLSGAGGGLKYGQVSNSVSGAMGYRKPITCAWDGRDHYTSVSSVIAAHDLMSTLRRRLQGLTDANLRAEINEEKRRLSAEIEEKKADTSLIGDERKRLLWRLEGTLTSINSQEEICRMVSSVTPSALDMFASVGFEGMVNAWTHALDDCEPMHEGGFILIRKDVDYDCKGMPESLMSCGSQVRGKLREALSGGG